MEDKIRNELRESLKPFWDNGVFAQAPDICQYIDDVISASTDDLLAWLPIPDHAFWELASDYSGAYKAFCMATLYKWLTIELQCATGKTLPEAILRCWLAWKMQEII